MLVLLLEVLISFSPPFGGNAHFYDPYPPDYMLAIAAHAQLTAPAITTLSLTSPFPSKRGGNAAGFGGPSKTSFASNGPPPFSFRHPICKFADSLTSPPLAPSLAERRGRVVIFAQREEKETCKVWMGERWDYWNSAPLPPLTPPPPFLLPSPPVPVSADLPDLSEDPDAPFQRQRHKIEITTTSNRPYSKL